MFDTEVKQPCVFSILLLSIVQYNKVGNEVCDRNAYKRAIAVAKTLTVLHYAKIIHTLHMFYIYNTILY